MKSTRMHLLMCFGTGCVSSGAQKVADALNYELAARGLTDKVAVGDLDAAKAGRENTSTPREMATLLENIYRCKVLDSSSTADFIRVLSTPKESYIPRYLPEDLQVANKPGSLAGVRSDCGIIFVPRRPFIISVMTTYVGDEKAAEEAIARIAEAAFKYFDIVGASSGYGRILYPRSRM